MTKKAALIKNLDGLVALYEDLYPPGEFEMVSTGSLALDYIFGGGFPLGKVFILSSPPGLGKTLISLFIARNILAKKEGVVLYLDTESAITPGLKETLLKGVSEDRFVHLTPPTYEAILKVVMDFCKTGKLIITFIDSISSVWPEASLEGGSKQIGAKSGAESLFCAQVKFFSNVYRNSFVYLNHHRAKIDFTGGRESGPKSRPAGGFALHHETDLDVDMIPSSYIKDVKGNNLGACAKLIATKNRVVGNRSAYIFLKYGHGISNVGTLASLLKYKGYVVQGGSYFSIKIPGCQEEPCSVQGNVGLEGWIRENFEKLVSLFESNKDLEDYFMNFNG